MTQENLHYLCDGKVVVYRRTGARSPNWYVRVKVEPTGRWKKFTTKTSDLEKAKEFALRKAMVIETLPVVASSSI